MNWKKKEQKVKDMIWGLKVFPPHLKQVCLERGLFQWSSFEPRTFFLVRRKRAYFYLSPRSMNPQGVELFSLDPGRIAVLKGFLSVFPQKPTHQGNVAVVLHAFCKCWSPACFHELCFFKHTAFVFPFSLLWCCSRSTSAVISYVLYN